MSKMSNDLFIVVVHLSYQASLQAHHSNNDKQTLQIQHNRLKIPGGKRQTSWLFYTHDPGVELGSTEKQLQIVVRAGFEAGTSGFQM